MANDGPLKQSQKHQTPATAMPTVKPKHELIEIFRQMLGRPRALVGTVEQSLHGREKSMHRRKSMMGRFSRSRHIQPFMFVPFQRSRVGAPTIRNNGGPRLDIGLNELFERTGRSVRNHR